MAIVIDLDLTGEKEVTGAIDRVAAKMDQLQTKFNSFGRSLRRSGGGGSASGGFAGGSGSSGCGSSLARAAQGGPFSALAKAQADYQRSLASGNRMQIMDAYSNLLTKHRTAQNAAKRMNPQKADPINSFLNSPLGKVVGSTRLNLGKFSPLIGQMLRLAGPLAKIALPILAAVKVIEMMAKAAEAARESFMKFRALQDTTGGRNLALGGAYAGALGMSPDAFAGVANRFVGNISSGGAAEGFAGQLGLRGRHDAIGQSQQDNLKLFFDAVDKVRGLSEAQARSFSRLTGTPELMQFRDMSQSELNRTKNIAARTGQMSESDRTALANFNGELGNFQNQIERLKQVIGVPLMKLFTMTLATWNNHLSAIMPYLNKFSEFINGIIDKMMRMMGLDPDKDKKKAEDANIKALNDNTKALNGAREVYGGGEKAKGAIPAAWRYNAGVDAMYNNKRALGAF